MLFGKFYSHDLKCMVEQVSKPKARRLYDEGKDIYFQSSNYAFDNLWQKPMCAQKNGYSFMDYTFDQICNAYEVFNCDNERGKYVHFFVKC